MNNPIEPPSLPPESPVPPLVSPPQGTGFADILDSLLKRPASLIQELSLSRSSRYWRVLALTAMAAFLLYGVLIGTFSGGAQLLTAPAKVLGGMLLSALICFPSLYIFVSLTGVEISLVNLLGVLSAMLALAGLLLLGFAPVAWVFSQSTQSVVFIGALFLAIWFIATAVGFRMLDLATCTKRGTGGVHVAVWKCIFILVAFQMTTTLRPIIGVSPHWLPNEKKFFAAYWWENVFKE